MNIDQAEGLRKRLSHSFHQAKTVAVVSGKGGVGKSNFVVNFSLQLIKRNKKILILDLDIGMGNIDILIGNRSTYSIVDLLKNDTSLNEIIEKETNGLHYIAGGSSLNQLFKLNDLQRNRFYKIFETLVHQYDYIFFDMGAGASEESLFFTLSADECIVITTPEPTSITDAYGMVKHIVSRNNHIPIYAVLNRWNKKGDGLASLKKFQKVIQQFLSVEVNSLGVIPDDSFVVKGVTAQQPYSEIYPKAKASKAIKQLADVYLREKGIGDSINTSFLGRLKNWMEG
ncbi:MinD/ParA family protein [Oceanobacillus sp. 1P07AA]|uniref:MinD/ParA family protein n=1 Tax=Oceanobacillus sp. 1P07AA TaxID=3132293 RepID=UPI0039A5A285